MEKVFVGSLNLGVTGQSIQGLFEKFGAVERFDLVGDQITGRRAALASPRRERLAA